jgi:hypothetical protein
MRRVATIPPRSTLCVTLSSQGGAHHDKIRRKHSLRDCGAMPWPDDPGIRETFSLRRFGPDGRPSESPAPGEWRCELHTPEPRSIPKQRPDVSRSEVLSEFEDLFTAELGRMEEALDGVAASPDPLKIFQKEVERGLAALKKTIAPPKPNDTAAKPKARRAPSRTTKLPGQLDAFAESDPKPAEAEA